MAEQIEELETLISGLLADFHDTDFDLEKAKYIIFSNEISQ